MPFTLTSKPTYRFKVTIRRPAGDGSGGWDSFEFLAEFRHLPQPDIDALFASPPEGGDRGVLDRVLVGWSGVKQPDGTDLPADDVGRTALLAEPGVQRALVAAWIESVARGPAKN